MATDHAANQGQGGDRSITQCKGPGCDPGPFRGAYADNGTGAIMAAIFEQDSTDMLALESMVDRAGVRNVLYALAHICGEKADHIRSNWQDVPLARHWEQRARTISRLALLAAMRD